MLDARLLELALQTSNDPMLIVDGGLAIAWSNLAAYQDPDRIHGLPLADFLAQVPPASAYFQLALVEGLTSRLANLPAGEERWRHPQPAAPGAGDAVLMIRWHTLVEMPERFTLLRLHHYARRRSDPGLAEQALHSQQVFMNQLIHELRTPLAIALGSVRRAALKLPAGDETLAAADYLQMASQELRRMQRLIDHLSVLTELDAGSQRWRLRPVLVGRCFEDWYQQLPDDAREHTAVVWGHAVENQHLAIDPEALNLVLNNLVDNAVRYGSAGSDVMVLLTAKERCLKIYVADWGEGIPVPQRDQVFDRFRRLEQHRDPGQADGAGLGLAVCRALLAWMKGQISLLPPPHDLDQPDLPQTVLKIRLPLLAVQAEDAAIPIDSRMGLKTEHQRQCAERLAQYLQAVREADASLSPADGVSEPVQGIQIDQA